MRSLALAAAALLCMASAVSGCVRDPLGQLAPGESGTVAEVRSGDTLVLQDGLVVRLAGIAAPKRGEPFSDEARQALGALASGRKVQLLYGGARRDRYDRALAQVRLAEAKRTWLQKAMLEAGNARVRTYADNRSLARPMLALEQAARGARRGLWGLPDYQVKLPVEARGRTGFQVIEGRVSEVRIDGADATMVLDGVTMARIPAMRLADFRAASIDPMAMQGRLIRVRGGLRRDDVLRLDHPEQVEVLKEAGKRP